MTQAPLESSVCLPISAALPATGEIPARPRRSVRIPAGAIALLVVLMLAIAGVWLHSTTAASAPATVLAPRTVHFSARPSGDSIALQWQGDAKVLEAVTRAIITIRDGEWQEDIPLDLQWLRTGTAKYQPVSRNVEFRLTLFDDNTGRKVSELSSVTLTDLPQTAATAPPVPATPIRPVFTPPPAAQASRSAELPEPPQLQGAASPTLAGPPVVRNTEIARPPQPVQTAQAPAKPRGSGKVIAPVLAYEVRPLYPPLALDHRVQGSVVMRLQVDATGRVAKVDVVEGPPVLRQAAVNAVKQWRYRPATLDGDPISMAVNVALSFNSTH